MNRKLAIALMLALVCGLAVADDDLEQLKAQTQKIEKRVDGFEKNAKVLQDISNDLKKQSAELSNSQKQQQQKIVDLSQKLNAVEGKQTTLGGSIEQLSNDTEEKTQAIDQTISTRSSWYGAAIASLVLLVGSCYWYLRRRSEASELTLSAQVKKAIEGVRSTEERIAKSDTVLADSLFEILNKLKVQDLNPTAAGSVKSAAPDHQLPLKLADEIHRMRKRLVSLPDDTKGLMPLQKSLERLDAELSEKGYEIVDHTGMVFTENLSVRARFVPSDDLGPDQKVISKVVVPQVNYKGVMIRMADIEVSIGS